VAHHPADTFELDQFLGRTLGVAAGNEDACTWICAMSRADGLPRLRIGRRCDRAGIDDDNVGTPSCSRGNVSAVQQLPLDGPGIRLCGPAAKILDVEGTQWKRLESNYTNGGLAGFRVGCSGADNRAGSSRPGVVRQTCSAGSRRGT